MDDQGSFPSSPVQTRPYRSHKIPACDFCRQRKTRCSYDVPGQPCTLCRMHGVGCSRTGRFSAGSASVLRKQTRPRSKHPQNAETEFVERWDGPSTGTAFLPSPVATSKAKPPPRTAYHNHHQVHPSVANATELSGNRHEYLQPFSPSSGPSLHPSKGSQAGLETNSSIFQGSKAQASVIVGPAAARDAQILEQYMSPVDGIFPESQVRPNPYNVYSDDPSNPVIYLNVPRQRVGLRAANSWSMVQSEIMEKIIEPYTADVVDLYFDWVHPCFPILDKKSFMEAYNCGRQGLQHALVCEVYAASLVYWKSSTQLAPHPCPDIRYSWNLAVAALHDEFVSPDISTVLASIIDLSGRPITTTTGNATNLGRTIALAHSLGLNRNPTTWRLEARKKNMRIRTWWGLLIHDRWSSLTHGTPSQISRREYDVPIPAIETLFSPGDFRSGDTGPRCFVALCELTEILGEVLPLIYDLQPPKDKTNMRILRKLECRLEDWEEVAQDLLEAGDFEDSEPAPGVRNLQLSFFALKMCLCRAALQESLRSEEPDITEVTRYYESKCRKSATLVVDFIVSLNKKDFETFWLPYSAYHFTSAATLLLRCALEADDSDIARGCVASAKVLVDRLRFAKDEIDWDLADICLTQCEVVVHRMNDANFETRLGTTPQIRPEDQLEMEPPADGFDQAFGEFPDLWNMFRVDGAGVL